MNAKLKNIGSDLDKVDSHVIAAEEYEEIPELTAADFDRTDAAWYVGGKAVGQAEGLAAFQSAMKKQKINITLDTDVVAWFKRQAGGRGYQTLINATLREAMTRKTLEETLRKVIREELHPAL